MKTLIFQTGSGHIAWTVMTSSRHNMTRTIQIKTKRYYKIVLDVLEFLYSLRCEEAAGWSVTNTPPAVLSFSALLSRLGAWVDVTEEQVSAGYYHRHPISPCTAVILP